jgi:glycosyltransferase involved in cell wall biosynthesis
LAGGWSKGETYFIESVLQPQFGLSEGRSAPDYFNGSGRIKVKDTMQPVKISVIIPVHNAIGTLQPCLEAVMRSSYPNFECLVVDDSSQDGSQAITKGFPVQFHQLKNGPTGPANARNYGAERATGDILVFIDADVVLYPDTIQKIADKFLEAPQYDALFGSYDESPGDGAFVSQYKNLTHHFVHQQADPEAETFWSGCGAIRREVFLEAGGFDARRFILPSIEDIELGGRLRKQGHRIIIDKDIEVKHLKRWTLKGMIKTDIFNRAIPWTVLIIQAHSLPNTLNLKISQRISAILASILLLFIGVNLWRPDFLLFLAIVNIFLFTVGLWDWEKGLHQFRTVPQKILSLTSLIGLTAIAAYLLQHLILLPGLAVLAIVTVSAAYLPVTRPRLAKSMFFVMIAITLATAAFTMAQLPYFVIIPIFSLLLIIVCLNFNLYLFYTRTRGLIFAIAALPFQLFYYIYSALSFAYTGILHYWKKLFKPKNSLVAKSSPRLSENN